MGITRAGLPLQVGGLVLDNATKIRTALKMRHQLTGQKPADVLQLCERAAKQLEAMQRLEVGEAEELRVKLAHARQMDAGGGQ
jgi:hypothetical protein